LTDRKKETLSSLCLFLTSLIWGFAFVAQVQGMEFMGAFTFGGVRFAMGALALLPVILLFERGRGRPGEARQTLLTGALTGVILFIASTLQQYGILLTQSAGKSGFITGLYTVLTPIFSIALGKRPGLLTALGAVSAFAGLYFLSVPEGFGAVTLGDALLVACAVFWAFHIMMVDSLASRVRPIRFSVVQFAVCAILSLISMALFEQPTLAALWAGRVPLLYGAFFSVGIAYTLQIVGQRHVPPAKAAIIFSLESLFAALGGFLLLKEQLGWKGWLGGALMFLGIVLSQVNIKKRAKAV